MAMMMKKVLCYLVVFVILMCALPVSVLAVNGSDNIQDLSNPLNKLENTITKESPNSGDCAPVPDADLPEIYLNDTQECVLSIDSGNDTNITILTDISDGTRETVSALGCDVYVKIDDPCCVGYCVYEDGVYQFTEGQDGTPDGYCAFYVSAGTHTIKITKNGRSASITKNFQCGYTYRWISMPHCWCEDGGSDDCKNPPIVKFDKTKYYDGDTVHATVSTSQSPVYYDIKDCYGTVRKSGSMSNGPFISYTIPKGASEKCCYWQICVYWKEYKPAMALTGGGGTATMQPSGCTKCYNFYVCPKTTCDVYVIIDDPCCVGYRLYVDDVYQFTEGGDGTTPDGYCAFHVKEGTHTLKITKNGRSASKTINFKCNIVYRWVSMPKNWCGDGKAYVEIKDKYCKGYRVYVDDVYLFTEGESGTPDGNCAFYVTAGTHKFELRKNGDSTSKSWDCQCGTDYRWVSMPDYWCGPCEVFVVIVDDTCVGYEVYVDDVYQFTEGQDELLDGFCEFYVTAGTHTIEIRKNGCSASMTGDFQPLTVVPIQWTSMPDCWCNCNKRDLIIQDITWSPGSSELGDTVTFTVIVENIGEFTADPSTVKYYINNQYIDFDNIPSLSPCATSTQTFTWTASSCGNVLVKAVADANNDVQECDETNNEKQKSSEIYGPDLIVQEISWPSEPVCLDKPVTITVTVKNQGNRAAGASTVKYYIDNLPIGSDTILGLYSGSTSTQTFSWTPTICGYHNIKAVADANNNVQECDETNNEKQKSVHVVSPDLIIQSMTWAPTTPKKGDSVTFTVTIKNQGDADADSSHVRLFIRNIEVDPVSASVGPIAAASTVSKTFTWTADSCAKTAVSVIADADNKVDESREDNNYLPETIYVKCPDLEITDISWSPKGDDLHAGGDMTISYKIRNNGGVDTKEFKTRIMIDSLPFRTFTQSLSANTEMTIEGGTWKAVRGTHSIKVETDTQKKVEESDETNNEDRADIVVDEEPVDLIITGIEVTQAIQNLDGDVPLIEGKDTFVRVYMKTNSRSIPNVKGTLKSFRNSKSIGEITNLNKWNYIAKDSGKKRPSIDERRSDDFYLLIFMLPDEWLSGDITIKVEIKPDPRYTLEEICSCTPCERKLQFNKAGRFTIAFVPIHHKPSNTKPDFGDFEKVYQEFVKLYPITKDDVSIEFWPALEIDYNPTNNESKECPTAWGNCGLRLLGDLQFLASYQTRKNSDQNLIVFGLVDSEVKCKAANHGPLWGYGEMGDGKTFGTRCAWGIDGTFGGGYMAHGIGHNLGRKHIACGGPKNIDMEWPYQGDECHLAPETPAGFWGFDVNERSVRAPSEYSDFMTYSAPYWVSNYTYTALFDLIKERGIVSSLSKSSLRVMSQPTEIDMILIRGLINISADEATFKDFFHIKGKPQNSPSMRQHRIEIQLQNSLYEVLVNHSFNISNPDGSDIYDFDELVRYDSDTAYIVLKHNSTVLASVSVGGHPPNVTVLCPDGGEILSGVNAQITWSAYDDDDDVLHYTVDYSPDNGSTWLPPIAPDLGDDWYLCDTSDLQGSVEGLIRVTAADGVNTGRDISDDVFTVPGKGPEVSIVNPTNGTLITEGNNIKLIGSGHDLEDGMLNDSALTWTSSLNGVLGHGEDIETRNLTRGVHTITLMGEDSNGNRAYDNITISVLDSATIYTPPKGTARLSATDGVIIGACRVNESLLPSLPEVEFPFGVFNFNISNISSGQTVNVSIELPQDLPSDAEYWMYGRTTDNSSPYWYDDIKMEICEDNRTVTIQLIDGGKGDDDMNKNGTIVVTGAPGVPVIPIFDTKAPANPYPSVSGTHTGTITPIRDVNISKLYTYPCSGTCGHTESIELYENNTLIANGTWTGYKGDWHNITIHNITGGVPYVTLLKTHKYNYTILTGSYPQIHHNSTLLTDNGWINCTDFTDSNGKRYYDWIPAIRLW